MLSVKKNEQLLNEAAEFLRTRQKGTGPIIFMVDGIIYNTDELTKEEAEIIAKKLHL